MVFLFTGQKYDKLDWIFMKRKNTHTHTHPPKGLLWNTFPVAINLRWKMLRFLVTRLFKTHQLCSQERHKSALLFAWLVLYFSFKILLSLLGSWPRDAFCLSICIKLRMAIFKLMGNRMVEKQPIK